MPKRTKCRARGCLSNGEVRYFSFPRDAGLLQLWKDNLRIPPLVHVPEHNAFLCIKHFEEGAVGPKYLKKGAIPTRNLGYDEDPPNMWTEKKKKRSCCIESCDPKEKVILFAFPKDEDTRQRWALACNMKVSRTDRVFICQRHFEPRVVTRYKLLKGAFPCLRLDPVNRSRSVSAGSDYVCPPITETYSTVAKEEDFERDFEEFEKCSTLGEKGEVSYRIEICREFESPNPYEGFAQSTRYQSNTTELNKRIEELEKENNDLKNKYSDLLKRAIIAEESCSSDALTFARMIVSTEKDGYNEDEKGLAQNLKYISTKAYTFMRDDLGFCLPH